MSTYKENPYKILGVATVANEKEIKAAFYNLAKKYHPDMSTEKSDANSEKFKKIAWAYEILSDPKKKAHYDATGSDDHKVNYSQAEDIFSKVWQEYGLEEFFKELQNDAATSLHAAKHGDFSLAWDFVKERKLLLSGLLIPIVLFVRFPGILGVAFRFAIVVTIGVLQSLPPHVAFNLFKRIFLRGRK